MQFSKNLKVLIDRQVYPCEATSAKARNANLISASSWSDSLFGLSEEHITMAAAFRRNRNANNRTSCAGEVAHKNDTRFKYRWRTAVNGHNQASASGVLQHRRTASNISCATKWFSKTKVSSQKMWASTRTRSQRWHVLGSVGPGFASAGAAAVSCWPPFLFLPPRPPALASAGRASPAYNLNKSRRFPMDHSTTSENIASSSMMKRRCLAFFSATADFSFCFFFFFLRPASPSPSAPSTSSSAASASALCASMDRTAVW
mmetsp:Transcript_49290/g.143479  ORF Transcript_49290/g.143479 Transcript_49290/m.143479 type:complete len:260 (-) Transcript_49290:318-1097(-)